MHSPAPALLSGAPTRRLFAPACTVALAVVALVQTATAAPELERIMADPDWIGPPVEAAWWQLDGNSYVYRVKRPDSDIRDLYRFDRDTGEPVRLGPEARAGIDGPDPQFDARLRRALSIRDGNLFLRDLASGQLRQLAGGPEPVTDMQFSADGQAVHYQAGGRWWRHDLARQVSLPIADLRFEDAPHAEPEKALERGQLRLFETLERMRRRDAEAHAERTEAGRLDPTRTPAPWYLGDEFEPAARALSANARWMLVVVEKAGDSDGRNDRMPRYVTRSGYVEVEDVRTLVGRDSATPQQLWLLDLENRTRHELDLGILEGRDQDPLAELKQARDIEPHDADDPRPIRITGMQWHPEASRAVIQVRAIDNKDRWTVLVETAPPGITPLHRLTDPAWINWAFNEFGWVPESNRVWLLSEQSGFAHLYTLDPADPEATLRQHTEGEFEVFDVGFSPDGSAALVISNRSHPTEYDLYRVDRAGDRMERLTTLRGVQSYAVHPVSGAIVLRWSESYLPPQAAILEPGADAPVAATDTRTEAYRAIDWQQPRIVGVPSGHVPDTVIWSKFYPARGAHDGPRPIVIFVHGAGYTQNTHRRFPYYFREQMFHNLLTERGWHVLDMDYRASRGYGRDWRTAIYRQMGTPELEDLVDGVEWLVEEQRGDPDRVGIYGGSYGGFMTFMAMFNAADTFAAGAALRPVTDWRHYNHGYTSNILNTPKVDPEAYKRSSPIEFVEKLQGHLLISHGMLDDNVFYKDSVRLVQRLIELKKQDWELASYPLEPHGYVHPESWLDQYRRILELFETTIGQEPRMNADERG